MTKVKKIKGVPLGCVELEKGEHVSFVFGGQGAHFCEISVFEDGTSRVMVDSMKCVTTIHEVTGGDD